MECAKKIIEASNDRKKISFKNWRNSLDEDRRISEIQKRFLLRLLMSKAGRVA